MDYIKNKLSLLTSSPGCYLMKNVDGIIIYVGKAKNLKKRVVSYFRGIHTGKTAKMISEIVDFEYIAVNSELESLILEINLIKKYDPKYNILLKDDKSYPYIELTDEKVPRLKIVRSINRKKDHKHLYGPYPNVTAARGVVNLLNRMYPIRKCNTYNKKTCLYFHINQCLGYCTNSYSIEEVNNMKNEIMQFLKGNHTFITNRINSEMNIYSETMQYEKALEMKKLVEYISITLAQQQVEVNDLVDRDIFGYYVDKGYLSIQVFFVRSSKIVGRHSKIIPMIEEENIELTRYIADFYNNIIKPKEVLVPSICDDELLANYLEISVKKPIKGEKLRIIEMANENAKIVLGEKFELIEKDEEKTILANEELKDILKLDKLDRIEIFDNSNLFGAFNVSGMVVFKNGKPSKNDYRKFKISIDKNDDYNTMKEVIYRRYFRVLKDDLERPDLVIVDGGLGQIHAAKEIIDNLNLNILVAGLKKDERHATSKLLTSDNEYDIDKRSNLFYYLERMQDEVHEFTINYHKKIRSKGSLSSILDNVDGIGDKRKKELLKKYKNITQLKKLSIEDLGSTLPQTVAENLFIFLQNY
jgi:excinuclease ABC, C subunit